ncbi:hypothetical protein TNCV_4649471 [Trichonephila clavipes]|uniref:Uncharacterized protein n=1 Tax=Trichonephila clavipes TaxID=2585209 RepID=A0A8X6VIC8_TRICX|nr:hypothetical protein TNCV_4649471 [Trichonephila clavipes]
MGFAEIDSGPDTTVWACASEHRAHPQHDAFDQFRRVFALIVVMKLCFRMKNRVGRDLDWQLAAGTSRAVRLGTVIQKEKLA